MSVDPEHGRPLTPLELLYQVTAGEQLTPTMVQDALNALDPRSPNALREAEEVLGFASYGAGANPDSKGWADILEGASKVFNNRLKLDELNKSGTR
ncbi:MAG: hypothetical protein ACYCPS_00775 [Candidatus Saccharimonadales bacterium]